MLAQQSEVTCVFSSRNTSKRKSYGPITFLKETDMESYQFMNIICKCPITFFTGPISPQNVNLSPNYHMGKYNR